MGNGYPLGKADVRTDSIVLALVAKRAGEGHSRQPVVNEEF
jgi:hypothetical protein